MVEKTEGRPEIRRGLLWCLFDNRRLINQFWKEESSILAGYKKSVGRVRRAINERVNQSWTALLERSDVVGARSATPGV